MTSNATTLTGRLPAYSLSNVNLEKEFNLFQSQHSAEGVSPKRPLTLQLKLALNNIFNAQYLSILSRPMPGLNAEFFLSITY